ncbi:hypothetical protein DRJ17_04950 [Candidatus Woesearchaeota archaeon]|nr:MAG: hypothetical protein DRJ17_04950 [Candidatus Woesearchaeota archaeon]
MNFIRKIFKKQIDDLVHNQFVRFGPGTYEGRAVIRVKMGQKIRLWTSFEFANEIIKFISENIDDETVKLKGRIYSKKDFKLDLEKDHEKKKGFFVATIDETVPVEELKKIVQQFMMDYMLFDVDTEEIKFKVKKAPHNPKGKFDEKFCNVTLDKSKKSLIDDLLFDVKDDYKEVVVDHMFLITDVVVDEKLVEKDPAAARLQAKRKGKIIRNLDIDGKKEIKEVDFLV